MSAIKHTPGPWTLESRGWDNQLIYGQDERVPDGRRFIADVSLMFDGAEANARLIAAAPDLLEQLRVTVMYLQSACTVMGKESRQMALEIVDEARSAIAKATGV